MKNDYQVMLASPEYLAELPRIERAAAEIFPAGMIPDEVKDYVLTLEEFKNALAKNHLWVAVTVDNQPIGFALVLVKGESAMLAELDVYPEHQRKGIGKSLVQTVINWACEEGYKSLMLTTFSNIPWNAPFYEKMGFRALSETELTADLFAALEKEAKLGLRGRVAMQIDFHGSKE